MIFIKPLLQKLLNKETKADFNAQYIGKIVKKLARQTVEICDTISMIKNIVQYGQSGILYNMIGCKKMCKIRLENF